MSDSNPIAPVCLAFLTCDAASQDARSGKYSLFGIFGGLGASKFPCVHSRINAFFVLTSGHGRYDLNLRVVDIAESLPPIFDFRFQVEFADPTIVGEYLIEIVQLEFPTPGQYCFQLLSAGCVFAERRMNIGQLPGVNP